MIPHLLRGLPRTVFSSLGYPRWVSDRWLPLLQASWADLDLAKVGQVVPERTPVARYLHALAESGYVGLGREVASAGHVVRMLGPQRIRHALAWFALLSEADELGEDPAHHVVTGGAVGRVCAEEKGFDPLAGIVIGMAAVLGLRKLFPTRAQLAVVDPALEIVKGPARDKLLIELASLTPSEAADSAVARYALPADLAELVVPVAGTPAAAVEALVQRALVRGGSDADRWARVRKAQPALAQALGRKLPGTWVGVAERDLEGRADEAKRDEILERAMGIAGA